MMYECVQGQGLVPLQCHRAAGAAQADAGRRHDVGFVRAHGSAGLRHPRAAGAARAGRWRQLNTAHLSRGSAACAVIATGCAVQDVCLCGRVIPGMHASCELIHKHLWLFSREMQASAEREGEH